MKRRMMALALAMCMAMGMNTVAFAADHNTAAGPHGTSSEAVVATDSNTMTATNPTGETQFYVNVDKDATSGNVDIPDEEIVPGDGFICHYELGYNIARVSNVSVTVPLYVCMYGYGGDGKIVTPADDAYQMKNSSTYSQAKELISITPCYAVNIITEGTLPSEAEDEFTDAGANTSGQWGWYQKEAGNDYFVVRLSDCDKHVAGNPSTACTLEYFYRGTTLTGDGDNITDQNNATHTIGTKTKTGEAPLPVNVPTIKAENQTWKLVEMTIDAAKTLKAGEICMSINGLDLSKAAEDLDIKDLDWKIGGPTVDEGGNVTAAAALDLPVKAVMAGGSVNEDGCVPVVRVTYTIAPQY